MKTHNILKINPHQPESELIDLAVKSLQNGGVIGYPTETIYGIGCSAYDNEAVTRIYQLKGRDHSKAMIVIAADILQISELVKRIPETAEKLMDSFWPGPLTMVFEVSEKLKQYAIKRTKTIAVRIPANEICLSLLKSCDFPIVSTSANKSGMPVSTNVEQVSDSFGTELDLIIDGGPTPSSAPSTVVDVTKTPLKIIREGAISQLEINTVLQTE
jgi:L-threonylcarbamoyladenylate synthase